MTDTDDPFPDAPSYEELEEMKQPMEDFDDISEFSEANEDWYNAAPYVAARLIVEAARENDEFREAFLEDDEPGRAHRMGEYDPERHEKLDTIGLSMFQGGSAENLAERTLRGVDE